MSDPFAYETVAPLIDESELRGRTAMFMFRCPASGHRVRARYMKPIDNSMLGSAAKTAKRSAFSEAQRGVMGMLRSVFGSGSMGRVAQQAASDAMRSATREMTEGFSREDEEIAAVEAFRSVSSQFTWAGGRWISRRAAAELMSDFERQVADHPVESAYDRDVLARMLVEIASADGRMEEAEQTMLADVLGSDSGSVQSLQERPALTNSELSQTAAGPSRHTLLMMAAVLALCDQDFDKSEQDRLQKFAEGLSLGRMQVQQVMESSRAFVLDQALESMLAWGDHDEHARAEVYALAERIGLTRKQADAVEARFLKRSKAEESRS